MVLLISHRDYRAMPALDRYDRRDLDDDVEDETFEEREAARLRAEAAWIEPGPQAHQAPRRPARG